MLIILSTTVNDIGMDYRLMFLLRMTKKTLIGVMLMDQLESLQLNLSIWWVMLHVDHIRKLEQQIIKIMIIDVMISYRLRINIIWLYLIMTIITTQMRLIQMKYIPIYRILNQRHSVYQRDIIMPTVNTWVYQNTNHDQIRKYIVVTYQN